MASNATASPSTKMATEDPPGVGVSGGAEADVAASTRPENGVADGAQNGDNRHRDGKVTGWADKSQRPGRGGKRKRGGKRDWSTSEDGQRAEGRQRHWRDVENKRRKVNPDAIRSSYMSIPFTADEIAAEERKPKRKVAVMIGYAGTGYHGIQINHSEKTIEGELFAAFVGAGAISKANADDPQKSKLVRCARTDKGVHAAGNVISLKLIIEDDDIVQRLNERLPPQIRVWGIQRTNNGFSCYQSCDSRWYEYLMPSYALLPPHPYSFLAKKIRESAEERGVYEEYMTRLGDVRDFWEKVEETDIKPILERLEPEIRSAALDILRATDTGEALAEDQPESGPKVDVDRAGEDEDIPSMEETGTAPDAPTEASDITDGRAGIPAPSREFTPTELAVREIKAAYVAAKRRYRVSPDRIQKLQAALDLYRGTNNFHNYTVQKSFGDSSALRHIKSFVVNPAPIVIRDTEWLSLKVHGQSFMMHQIRKMVAMAVMLVRSGAPLDRVTESYGPRRISIPKAPGLGLLLERPVFENYNKRATENLGRDTIDFAKYETQILEFKDREIYKRMFDVEERDNIFHTFFNQLDNFRTDYFLWCTAAGFEASYQRTDRGVEKAPRGLEEELGEEAEVAEDDEG